MGLSPILVWFRRDLRLADNPALAEAAATGAPVLPVYVFEDDEGPWSAGSASRWWRRQAVAALARDCERLGAPLVVRRGQAEAVIPRLATEAGARQVFFNRRYERHAAAVDQRVERALAAEGIPVRRFNAGLLFEPGEINAQDGEPYQIFAGFWRAICDGPPPPPPLPPPARLAAVERSPESDPPPPEPDHEAADGWAAMWRPGEAAAIERLDRFLSQAVTRYAIAREHPDQDGTSRLSPHLAFGEIGPRQIWHAVRTVTGNGEAFLRELCWREFCYHTLHRAPELPDRPLRREFAGFPWAADGAAFDAWRSGNTGYPIVDAGMRALAATGWLHNRVRMIVASFLVKDLLIPWQDGQRWFWERLVDADLAANAANWQWVAGCGIDAAPYFRIFNPVLQGEKFDARGRFVRQWVPELAGLPDLFIHRPWLAPAQVLSDAGVRLGESYPLPIVDHGAARRRALAAYQQTRGAA